MRNILTGELPPGVVDLTPAEVGGFVFPQYTWPRPSDIPPLQWLLGHWLLRGVVTLLAAPGGMGKTSLTVAMAIALASGRSILGKPLYGGVCRVVLWNLEDDMEQMARQIAAVQMLHGISAEDCDDRLYVLSGLGGLGFEPMPLVTATQDDGTFRLNEAEFQRVEDALVASAADVLIIDPFISSHHARENDTESMDRVLKRTALMATRTGCAVLLPTHTRKANGERSDADSVRGSSAMVNAARVVLMVNRMTDAEAAAFGLADEERRRLFSVDLGKANRSAPEAVEWFRMESVALGNGGDSAGDEVGAVATWAPPTVSDGLTSMQLEMVRTAIGNGSHRAASASTRWAGAVVGQALGIDHHSDQGKARLKLLLRQWLTEGKLFKVERRDEQARKSFEFIELGPVAWFEGASQ